MSEVNTNESPDSDDIIKVKLEEALSLNRQMQLQLLLVREKLEKLLTNVKENYKANDVLLKDGLVQHRRKGVGIKGAYLRGGTFYLKGNMFFKDIKCRNCPNNPDYERRKSEENEIFPMDLELQSRHIWSTKDKQGVVLGIKEQIIDYLKSSSKKLDVKKSEIDSEKLVKLLNMVPNDFSIDWDYISSCNVQYRHSAASCHAIWNVFLNPKLKRSSWSNEENEKLLKAAKKFKFQNWQAIAQEVGQRSDFQCFVQYQNFVCYMLPEIKTTKWTKEDDKRLLDVVAKNTVHGVINWSNVMSHFPHKAKTTLQSRYTYSLDPDISHAPFTPEEDLLLLAAVKEYGTKFNCLPRNLFPNRTVVQLRSRYKNTLLNRHNWHPWTLEDDLKLMEFVTQNGTKSWLECSKYFHGKHTRTSCRTRFFTVKNFMEKNPDATLEQLRRKCAKPMGCITTENWKEKLKELKENPKADLNKPFETHIESKKIPKLKTKSVKLEKPKKVKKVKNIKITRAEERNIVPYISRLKANDLKSYNFFKYSYNFLIDQDPCDKILPNNQILTIVRSALNPQISLPFQNYQFDDCIPAHVRPNIKACLQETSNYQVAQLLPPNMSSAMGFRALCIHAACNDPETEILQYTNESNDHIEIFRQRLRILFYSTALLSRLHPSMVRISTPVEFKEHDDVTSASVSTVSCDDSSINCSIAVTQSTENLKRRRLSCDHDNNNKPTNKKKCNVNIQN